MPEPRYPNLTSLGCFLLSVALGWALGVAAAVAAKFCFGTGAMGSGWLGGCVFMLTSTGSEKWLKRHWGLTP